MFDWQCRNIKSTTKLRSLGAEIRRETAEAVNAAKEDFSTRMTNTQIQTTSATCELFSQTITELDVRVRVESKFLLLERRLQNIEDPIESEASSCNGSEAGEHTVTQYQSAACAIPSTSFLTSDQ